MEEYALALKSAYAQATGKGSTVEMVSLACLKMPIVKLMFLLCMQPCILQHETLEVLVSRHIFHLRHSSGLLRKHSVSACSIIFSTVECQCYMILLNQGEGYQDSKL